MDPAPEIRFPKSLYLIQPLFSAYQLNPVSVQAQASVPVPESLDLDTWFVPPPKPDVIEVKKSKKGKGKETNGVKSKHKRKEKKGTEGELLHEDVLTPEESETVEQRIAREQVRENSFVISIVWSYIPFARPRRNG